MQTIHEKRNALRILLLCCLLILQTHAAGGRCCFAEAKPGAGLIAAVDRESAPHEFGDNRELSWFTRNQTQVVFGVSGLLAIIFAVVFWNILLQRAVTLRTRALESALRQNKLLLHSAGEGIYGVDLRGQVTFINPAAANMVGWDGRELIGKTMHDVVHHTRRDGSSCAASECRIYAAFQDGATHHSDDEVFWKKDGTSFPVEYTSTPIQDERNAILGAVITFKDVTWRKQAEHALRESNEVMEKIFSMATTCIAYMDRDFNFIRVNDTYAEADGRQPGYFKGKNHFALFPNAENEAIFTNVVETGQQHFAHAKPFEYKNHPERGVSHWDWSLTPVKDQNGVVESVILSLINVTDRIKAQEELSNLNAALEARVRERTAELENKNAELERLNKLFIGRELRMTELKDRIRELEQLKR